MIFFEARIAYTRHSTISAKGVRGRASRLARPRADEIHEEHVAERSASSSRATRGNHRSRMHARRRGRDDRATGVDIEAELRTLLAEGSARAMRPRVS